MICVLLLFFLIFAIAVSTWDSDFHRHHIHPHLPVHIVRHIPQTVYNRPWAFRKGSQVVFIDHTLTETTMLRFDGSDIQNYVISKDPSRTQEESRVSWTRVASTDDVQVYKFVFENQFLTVYNYATNESTSMSVADMDNALFR